MTLERGFKAWAERTAASLRRELGVGTNACFPPECLARHLGVRLWTPEDVPGITDDILHQLLVVDPSGWSAVTATVGESVTVIFNPRSSDGRRSSDVMHELAHLILNHEPATLILSESDDIAMRSFNQKQEDEANCLAWTILLPRDSLVAARRRQLEAADIARTFGVSETLVQFRLRTTGVDVQLRRRRGSTRSR